MKSGEPSRVTAATKSKIDCFVAPSFHDGSGVADDAGCASAASDRSEMPEMTGNALNIERTLRRLRKSFDMAPNSFGLVVTMMVAQN
jgi:hypothetical protein